MEQPYLHVNGMTWPNPHDPAEVEHALRYGTATRVEQLVAASFIAAYRQLVGDPQRVRNAKVTAVRAATARAYRTALRDQHTRLDPMGPGLWTGPPQHDRACHEPDCPDQPGGPRSG